MYRSPVIASCGIYASLEISRIGLTAHLTRQQGCGSGTRSVVPDAHSCWISTAAGEGSTALQLAAVTNRMAASAVSPDAGCKRVALARVLEVASSKQDLPRIYRHLFRLAPVEDRRFLVGRDEELRGFEEAVLQKGPFWRNSVGRSP